MFIKFKNIVLKPIISIQNVRKTYQSGDQQIIALDTTTMNVYENEHSNDVLIQRQEAMPKVSAYGNYTAFQQNYTFNPFATNTWFPYSFIGVRISFPLYDGRLNQRKMERLKQEMVISDLKQSQYDDELKEDIAGLRDIYLLTKQELDQIEELLQLSQKIYNQDKIEYDKGRVSYESLLSSKLNLEQHYLDKLSAIERLYQAKSNMDQAALER